MLAIHESFDPRCSNINNHKLYMEEKEESIINGYVKDFSLIRFIIRLLWKTMQEHIGVVFQIANADNE